MAAYYSELKKRVQAESQEEMLVSRTRVAAVDGLSLPL